LNGQLLQSSVLHLCLSDNNIEILSEDQTEDHCKKDAIEDSCCSIEVEESESCEDCYSIEVDDEDTFISDSNDFKFKLRSLISHFDSIDNSKIISQLIEVYLIDLPPPNYLAEFLSTSFLRGPTQAI